jgi:Tol biopolymer transport system component/DNA-binding winged helix-turn-helix (wHTH) protein
MLDPSPSFYFGTFEVYPSSGELRKGNGRIRIQEQPFRLLVLLLGRAGMVVSREELQKALWPNDTFVEFEQGLNTAVRKLRFALGDSADNPRFIETVPRKGYRFVAPVRRGDASTRVSRPAPQRRQVWAGLGAAAMILIALWLVWTRTTPPQSPFDVIPLTTYPGVESQPALSPDGQRVAFTWNGEHEDNFDIYVKEIGSENAVRLTRDPGLDFGPAWSPDGRVIAFSRVLASGRKGIFLTPAAGGPEAKIGESSEHEYSELRPSPPPRILAWSPDGKWLAVSDRDDTQAAQEHDAVRITGQSLFLLSIASGERRRLTSQNGHSTSDIMPAFSPDGRTLAFARRSVEVVSELYILPLSPQGAPAGPPKQLHTPVGNCRSPVWTGDGKEIVFSAGGHEGLRLWRMPATGTDVARRLELGGEHLDYPTISRRGELAYSQLSADANVWEVALAGPGQVAGLAHRLLASTRSELNPHYSPDGRRIVFPSNRSGFMEIWIANADGSNPLPLTSMRAALSGGPNWSPDGSYVAFDSTRDGQWEVYVISAAGGTARRMTSNPARDGVPSWSRDGAWIYFMSDRSGAKQVWRMPIAGGPAVQVTRHGGYVAVESPDGRFVYYSKSREGIEGLWRIPTAGGDETQVLPSVTFLNFDVAPDGIYFIPAADKPGPRGIHYLNLATGKDVLVTAISGEVSMGLSVSPGGKALLYSQIDRSGSDLMLVDGFR